jgi:hypothetical protein
MIDTIAAGTRRGSRALTAAACVTFALGALAGGVVLFGGLAGLGALLASAGGGTPAAVAAALAAGIAMAELAGIRVRPQVRRQVPEHWRRSFPLPLATLGYGALLGLGFTTFVLSLAVPALAVLAVMIGDPALGIALGACFGAGRALPVVALAPVADSAFGRSAVELMAERPVVLRGLRAITGIALALCAVELASGPALAATTVARHATDPSAVAGVLAWQTPGGLGVARHSRGTFPLTGRAPAVGGGMIATIEAGETLLVRQLSNGTPVFSRQVRGADKLAVTSRWLVVRRFARGRARIVAFRLGTTRRARLVARAGRGVQLGRPAAQGDRVVWHATSRARSRIVEANLRTRRRKTRLSARAALLLNPSIDGRRTVFVRVTACGQSVVLLRGRKGSRVLARRGAPAGADSGFDLGHTSQGSGATPCPHRRVASRMAWTTAVTRHAAYVTFIRPSAGAATDATVMRFRF